MSRFVIDASAVLVLLGDEPGSAEVEAHLSESAISAVNLAEVIGKLAERGMPDGEIEGSIGGLGLDVHDFNEEMALTTGKLRRETRDQGLSLGDRACLALGLRLGAPVLTADRSWKDLKIGVRVIQVR